MQGKLRCGCGKEYWPNQGWMHEKCAVNRQPEAVNKLPEVAVNKVRGKYPGTDQRRGYMKEYMRKKRASSHPEKMTESTEAKQALTYRRR